MEQIFAQQGVAVCAVCSRGSGEIETMVKDHINAGATKVIVAGGDGSIHEAVNGVLAANTRASLGVIPSGTGNDFAKACSISLDWEQAADDLARRIAVGAATRKVDVGRMNERYFANSLGIGFEAKVTQVARAYRWPIGDLVYLVAILRCLIDGVATSEMNIIADGSYEQPAWRGAITLASICNGAWVGGMFHMAPMADNADGQLDLLIAAPVTRRRVLALLPRLLRGRHLQEAEITHRMIRSALINSTTAVESHLDGEVQPMQARFDIEILPAALDLL
ncbi:MAG: YegS/Rv2252/BmrU family lipid kinase [Gammaproteobacteria bacterium]|nr:YegS/Rv2252/BmrU family lipid kinase [Gammaproteobacteria bacterium]MDH5305102.1 YegS/Rv2252/BmrU family lipid kinase [Gammaproteobacteria bacterium]MDH5321769.1 YegS/Rv2252/BmrU family lipid kinase [Gammaproteobacteria bacterium]